MCVVLDEDTHSAQQTRALGVEVGDFIALEPRMTVSNGYVKSHFVDDKACAAVLLAVMQRVHEHQLTPNRHTYFYFAAYEEIGHGTTWLPQGVQDILAVDIAPTGPDQTSDERKVSLFAKDSRFPYHLELLRELQDAADRAGVDYVTDVFTPHYGSDGDGTVLAGYDVRHGAIGPGTANSHGYERTHLQGLDNTYRLLVSYLGL
ncbi:MAG: M20/M25/M40 family metallo-hydrolase [Oscillospiraceae bacterium]|nr:M20/M25/M40 family metallo-hydrolase [Oscillospiraceae bacterium]